jgi:uncharacterized repeat protein (TIGR03987 family)
MPFDPLATGFIISAFLAYTFAVWGEQYTNDLKPIFVVFFVIGVICDSTGTFMMAMPGMGAENNPDMIEAAFHMITGLGALLLMLIRAIWALMVLFKKDEQAEANFHRFSRYVWVFWLIPFGSGLLMGMLG